MKPTYEQLQQQLAVVVAENEGAKKVISECREYFIAGVMNRIRPTNEGYLHMICDTFADETPTTDAYLAEVRSGEAKSIYESILDNPAVTDMESLVDWLEQHAKDSASFAAQLRQGEKS